MNVCPPNSASKVPHARSVHGRRNPAFRLRQLLCLAACAVTGSALAAEFHVAPAGSDQNPGTAAQPFATLKKARDAVRAESARAGSTVILHSGVYRLDKPLEFGERDSGTRDAPVVWKSAPGETARIIGGVVVPAAAAKPVADAAILQRVISLDARKGLREIDLASLGITDCGQVGPRGFRRPYIPAPVELFIGGKPMSIARWPNPGQPLIPVGKVLDKGSVTRNGEKPERGGKFEVTNPRPKLWAKADDVWISGLFENGYADSTVKLATITDNGKDGVTFTTVQPHMYGFSSGKAWNAWFAMNLVEEIDLPGEYAIDRQAGKLYFLPPPGMDPAGAEIIVSALAQPLLVCEGATHLRFENLTVECSRGMGVYVERGEDVCISGCTLRNLGMLAVCFGRGVTPDPLYRHAFTGTPLSRELGSWHEHLYDNPTFNRSAGSNHRVTGCEIYDNGAGAVSLSGGDRKTLTPGGNVVEDCHIHHFNRWERTYRAAVNVDGVGNRIAHCLIHDAPGSAIYLHGNNNIVEFNDIHNVMEEGDDMGAVYLGRDPSEFGNLIRYNYIHEVGFGKTHGTLALYYDDGACGTEAYGNVFVKAGRSATVNINGGKYNPVHDNIFIDCNTVVNIGNCMETWGKKNLPVITARLTEVNSEQPPYSTAYPQLANYWRDNPAVPTNSMERNLVVNCRKFYGKNPAWGLLRDNWETKNDPGFVDMAKGDYTLKPDAEVFKKITGFKPGPFKEMGLRKKTTP